MIKDHNIDPNANIQLSKIQGNGGNLNLLFLSSAPRPSADIAGRVFYVHPDYGSDSNDGLAPDRPFKTILKARTVQAARINWSGSPWANQDMIILFPGIYDETALTGGLYGVNVVGLGDAFDINGEMGVTIKAASGSAWDAASWINGGLYNTCLHAPTDEGSETLLTLDTWNRFTIADCVFQGLPGASATTLIGFQVSVDGTGSKFLRNWINQCLTGVHLGVGSSKQITGCRFEDLVIMASETAGIHLDSDCTASGTLFKDFIIGPTPALGIDDDASSPVAMFVDGHIYATACDPATSEGGKYSGVYLNDTLLSTD